MQQVGKITHIKGNICTIEFVTTIGCCGGKKTDDGEACCGEGNARVLSFKVHCGQHTEVKVGDQVVVESDSFMVWWQAFVAILFPSALGLGFYYGLEFSWEVALTPFPATWVLLGLSRCLFPRATMPVITVVNPPVFRPTV